MRKRILLLAIGLSVAGLLTGCNSDDYKKAASLYEEGNYEEAITMYEELGDYKDSKDQLNASKFLQACKLQDEGNYDEAIAIYDELGDYEASVANKEKCYLGEASKLVEEKNYTDALAKLDGYTDTEEGKHLADICNVHINGMDGLITYMQENIEMNDNGDNAISVKTGKDNKAKVLLYYDKDNKDLEAEVSFESDSGADSTLDITLSGQNKGDYELIFEYLTKVNLQYAYYNNTLKVGNNYYVGYNINAFGNVNLKKFSKETKCKIKTFKFSCTDDSADESEFKDMSKGLIKSSVTIVPEGLQQFINDEDLRISVKELGFENYETTFAEDPYSIAVTPGDYSADTTVNGEIVDISKSLDTNSDKDTSEDSTGEITEDSTKAANASTEKKSQDASGFTTEGTIDVSTSKGKAVYSSCQMAPDDFFAGDSKGKKALIVNFDYTNLEDSQKEFQNDFWVDCYQNGVELSTNGTYSPGVVDSVDNFYKTVIKDGTITIGGYYFLEDESPVTVILSDNTGTEDISESMIIDLK